MPNPIESAQEIFEECLSALMAHTIRATQNHFRKKGLILELKVVADVNDVISLTAPGVGPTSIVQAWHLPPRPGTPGRVQATIFIHQHANKDLARLCIAHEIYHLLVELEAFIASGHTKWTSISVNKALEDQCNQFAWELCKRHDDFNRDEGRRAKFKYFPEGTFDKPITTNAKMQAVWPNGIALDSKNPFYKAEA